jgi:hypothetical protein
MNTARRRIALVADAGETRSALATYLTDAGFNVYQCEELTMPSGFAALVLVGGRDDSGDSVTAIVRSWMRVAKSQRVVVVTSKPKALTGLVASYSDRLRVLPAPAFGWDLVDALRTSEPTRPSGA